MIGTAIFILVLSVAGLAVAGEPSAAPPVAVTTRVEPKSVTIGTPFRYTMRVEVDGDVEVVLPLAVDRIGDFLIMDFGERPGREEGGGLVSERWYDLVTYEAGDQIVAGPSVQYRAPGLDLEEVDTPDALVMVESLLPAAGGEVTAGDVRDIKGPVAVPRDYRPLLLVLGALLLLAGIGAGLYWALNRARRAALGPPPRPAHEVALAALARLHSARLLESGRHGEYYVGLSAIARTYIEARFRLRAPEMTTEEFLQAMQRDPQLASRYRSLLSEFLNEADLVKFARHVPSSADAERAYGAARQFVESTSPIAEVARAAA